MSGEKGSLPTIVLSILLVISAFAAGYFFWLNQRPPQQVKNPPTETELVQKSFPQGPKIETGWKTYENKNYGFSLNYPEEFKLEELENQTVAGQNVILLKSPSESFSLDVHVLEDNHSRTYLGYPVQSKVNYGSISWEILQSSEKGYCDAGYCSGKQTVYQNLNGKVLYAFVFGGKAPKEDIQKEIVSSFYFAPKSYDGMQCLRDKTQLESFIEKFESYQKTKNAKGALSLFTPASTKEEIDAYTKLSGDSPNSLFKADVSNFDLESYSLHEEPTDKGPNVCRVWVEENRNYANGFIPSDSVGPFDVNFILVKRNSEWKVDIYSASGWYFKYAGWWKF